MCEAINKNSVEKLVKLELFKRKNLTQVSVCNQEHDIKVGTKRSIRKSNKAKSSPPTLKNYKIAYEKYNKENLKECSQISIQDFLLLIHLLSEANEKRTSSGLERCLRVHRQNCNFQAVKESPHGYLSALRLCLFKRDWNKTITYAILLINFNKRYLQIVKHYCKILIKFCPLLQELGLDEQLLTLTNPSKVSIAVV